MALNETIYSGSVAEAVPAGEMDRLRGKMEELVKETNQFTYIITHDLQAPLRMISGFLELIEKRYAAQLDDTGKQYIDYAMKGSLKMKSLIFDLLEYSRLSSIEQVFAETDMNEILFSVMEELKQEITYTGAVIRFSSLPVIRGDKRLLTILFRHLLDNALKFRGEAIPEISISAEQQLGYWVFTVSDNGIGIDSSFLEKVFIIFRRLHTDETKYPGSGTGLAVCKKIAEIHGGTIQAMSEAGKGTTIKLQLAI